MIEFGDYYANELTDILEDRCRIGFNTDTYSQHMIVNMAKISFDWALGARGAIDLAQRAAEIAEFQKHDKITQQDVEEAKNQLHITQDSEVIHRLPPPRRALLAYIAAKSPISSEAYTFFRGYAALHNIGDSLTQFHVHLNELVTLGLVASEKRGHGRGKGVDLRLAINPQVEAMVRHSLEQKPN